MNLERLTEVGIISAGKGSALAKSVFFCIERADEGMTSRTYNQGIIPADNHRNSG